MDVPVRSRDAEVPGDLAKDRNRLGGTVMLNLSVCPQNERAYGTERFIVSEHLKQFRQGRRFNPGIRIQKHDNVALCSRYALVDGASEANVVGVADELCSRHCQRNGIGTSITRRIIHDDDLRLQVRARRHERPQTSYREIARVVAHDDDGVGIQLKRLRGFEEVIFRQACFAAFLNVKA